MVCFLLEHASELGDKSEYVPGLGVAVDDIHYTRSRITQSIITEHNHGYSEHRLTLLNVRS
jgi:hypothetical protein